MVDESSQHVAVDCYVLLLCYRRRAVGVKDIGGAEYVPFKIITFQNNHISKNETGNAPSARIGQQRGKYARLFFWK